MPLNPADKKQIFEKLKSALQKCSPPMVVNKNKKDNYELIGNKEVPYGSTKKMVPGMYFSSIVVRPGVVSFYLFPLYYHHKEFSKIIPSMMKYLKGKTCFAFKKPEQINAKELDVLLKKGVETWTKAGYMK